MKKIISLFLTLVLVVGSLAVLSSCGAPEDDGAQINVYLGNQIYDFDPSDYYVDSNAEQMLSLLFEPLFKLNKDGNPECAVAEKYEIDEYERTIKVQLRETYWSDGKRVTAADFIYSWTEKLLNPNIPNPAAALLYGIEEAAAVKSGYGSIADIGIAASSTYEIEITYRRGVDPKEIITNLASVATSPLRQDIVDQASSYWSKRASAVPFNGPFSVAQIDYDTGEFTLARNKGYHQPLNVEDYDNNVRPGEIHAVFTVDGEATKVSYDDLTSKTRFIMTDAPLSDRKSHSANTVADDTSVYTYVFNTRNPLFADANVRKALSVAIDRNAIINAISVGKAANGFIPDASNGSSEALINASENIQLANELLSQVDLSDVDKSFVISIDNTEQSIAIAEIVVAAWNSLDAGFDVSYQCVEPVNDIVAGVGITDSGIQVLAKEASYGNVEFDVLAVDWQTYSTNAFVGLAAFSSSLNGCGVDFSTNERRENISGWFNARYDYLLSEAVRTSGNDRVALLTEAERILVEEAPICPLVFNQSVAYTNSEIKNLKVDGFGNFVFNELELNNYKDYPGTNGQSDKDDDSSDSEDESVTE